MKLRNKKTGDIWEFDGGFSMKASRETTEKAGGRGCSLTCYAHSLAELNAEWEDAQPAEPLIKDEKVRKAVRAWAEANGDTRVYYHRSTNEMCVNDDKGYVIRTIKFKFEFRESIGLESGYYSITELCGEEEE